MFKRLNKFNKQRQKDEARGIDISQDAPPEALMDEVDDEDSSSDDSSDDSEDEEDEGEEEQAKAPMKQDTSDADEDEAAGSASGSGSASGGEDDDDEEEVQEEVNLDLPPISITQSLQSPFYISPTSSATVCLVCPLMQIKTDTTLDLHINSKTHKRRYERYCKYVAEKLSQTEREAAFEAGGADPVGVVREIEGEVKRRIESSQRKPSKQLPRPSDTPAASEASSPAPIGGAHGADTLTPSERALARKERKKANKMAWKQAKAARKQEKLANSSIVISSSSNGKEKEQSEAGTTPLKGKSSKTGTPAASANGKQRPSGDKKGKKQKQGANAQEKEAKKDGPAVASPPGVESAAVNGKAKLGKRKKEAEPTHINGEQTVDQVEQAAKKSKQQKKRQDKEAKTASAKP